MSYNSNNSLTLDNNLSNYLKNIRSVKMLTHEEEYNLAVQWLVYKNVKAAQALMISFLPLVTKIAYKYKNYGQPINDLISEGTLGLIKAINKFDIAKGFRLATYALWWIKAYITDYILASYSMVPQGTIHARKKLFFSLNRLKHKLGYTNRDLSDEEAQVISEQTQLPVQEVHTVSNLLSRKDLSLEAPAGYQGGGEESYALGDLIDSQEKTPEMQVAEKQEESNNLQQVADALDFLSERERLIVERRFLLPKPQSLREISEEFYISRERVRQIEARALAKARKFLTDQSLQKFAGLLPAPDKK